jgi:hypothetical protein
MTMVKANQVCCSFLNKLWGSQTKRRWTSQETKLKPRKLLVLRVSLHSIVLSVGTSFELLSQQANYNFSCGLQRVNPLFDLCRSSYTYGIHNTVRCPIVTLDVEYNSQHFGFLFLNIYSELHIPRVNILFQKNYATTFWSTFNPKSTITRQFYSYLYVPQGS